MFLKLILAGLMVTVSVANHLQWPATGQGCILIDLEGNNTVEWNNDNDNKTYAVSGWGFDKSEVIGGNCSGEEPYLEIRYSADNATMRFTFSKNSGNETSVDMTLMFEPDVVFKDYNNTDNTTASISVSYKLGPVDKSFLCKSQESQKGSTKDKDYEMTLRISNMKIQGFNVKDGKFSEEKECSADPTPKPTPTPTPSPSPPTPAPQTLNKVYLNATDGNKTCAMVAGKFQFVITYTKTDNKTGTATVDIPTMGLNSTGNCSYGAIENLLTATFNKNWSLAFDFRGDASSFWIKSLTLMYPLDSPYFPGSKDKTMKTVTHVYDDSTKQNKAAVSGSYMCNSESKIDMNSTVTLHLTDFQYAALQKNISSFTDSNISQCSADAKTSSIVPIAVGAALAGLVVIVLIAYLIGRRRNRKGYESV